MLMRNDPYKMTHKNRPPRRRINPVDLKKAIPETLAGNISHIHTYRNPIGVNPIKIKPGDKHTCR